MADEKPTEYVTLVSNDGFEFKILRSAACIAGTIKKALDPLCKPSSSHTYISSNNIN
jgi:transcription elongation factor B subunit 1